MGIHVQERYTHKGKTQKPFQMTDKEILWKENVKLHGINFSSITINRLIVTYV